MIIPAKRVPANANPILVADMALANLTSAAIVSALSANSLSTIPFRASGDTWYIGNDSGHLSCPIGHVIQVAVDYKNRTTKH